MATTTTPLAKWILNTRSLRSSLPTYWVTQKLPQICTVILRICNGKVA